MPRTYRALLVNPRQADNSRAVFSMAFAESVRLMGREAAVVPLGLLSVASLLPSEWALRVVDQNVGDVREPDWAWCDIVLVTGYNDQAEAQAQLLAEARRRGKITVAGGGWASVVPQIVLEAGADFVVVGEGELGVPVLVEQLEQGITGGIIKPAGTADVAAVPVPRYDLVDLSNYALATVQYSRGCPFKCEFCDAIAKGIGGPATRSKAPEQFVRELAALYAEGWRGGVYIADDNFIGNRKHVRDLLPAVTAWMARHRYPFTLMTEASINLALDRELTAQMVEAGFARVFVGIESTDHDALDITRKRQNFGLPTDEACRRLARAGLEVGAMFILGFDGESAGSGSRMRKLIDAVPITIVELNFLVALPQAALWQRLEREGRLRPGIRLQPTGPLSLNFATERPLAEILREGLEFIDEAFAADRLLDRCWRQHREIGRAPRRQAPTSLADLRSFAVVAWRFGVRRSCRAAFWRAVLDLSRFGPKLVGSFLRTLVHAETCINVAPALKTGWRNAAIRAEEEAVAGLAA